MYVSVYRKNAYGCMNILIDISDKASALITTDNQWLIGMVWFRVHDL